MRKGQRTEAAKRRQDTAPEADPGRWSALAPDLYYFIDSCNVYLMRFGDRAVVIDAGTCAWVDDLARLGVAAVDAIVLTHAHRDQCCGLYRLDGAAAPALAATQVVVPIGDAALVDASSLADLWRARQGAGVPACYTPPRDGLAPHSTIGADSERAWGPVRLCAVATPGHTRGALSYVATWGDRQLAFCGDAAHAGGCVHEPYHLEWDHWTAEGALAAWYGLERLAGNRIDRLLPSHGEPVGRGARQTVQHTQRRLLDLVRAKTAVAAGAASRWLDLEPTPCGARRISDHLYAVGGNGFLLTSDAGTGLLVDPTRGDLTAIEALTEELGVVPEVATASHFHSDHTDALDDVRQRWGARVWLHPWVAEPIRDRDRLDVPWLPRESITADRILPEEGAFRWREYRFRIRPFPGQTWWHCAFDAHVDGQRVLFSGDNFQPPTRWNGTGGFCAYNGSRFHEGFTRSAQAALDVAPDIVCNGHGCIYRFDAGHYRRILAWSARAEDTVRALCPSGQDWLADYDPRTRRWEPFSVRCHRGRERKLSFVYTNHTRRARRLTVSPRLPEGLTCTPGRRTVTVPAGATRRTTFRLRAGLGSSAGLHLVAADVEEPERLRAEACVALVEVS